jgi:hypothetical protein
MNQFRSFILQYTSNAVERAACHYKERSLTFRIVASRVLSRAPSSSPPADSTQPAAHSICRVSLRMATPQQKVFCVLELVRTNSVVTVRSAVQALSGGSNSCRTQDVCVREKALLSPWCCPCCSWWSYWEGQIHVSWYYWLLGKYSLIKSVHSL